MSDPVENAPPPAPPPLIGSWLTRFAARGYPLATLLAFVIYGALALGSPGTVAPAIVWPCCWPCCRCGSSIA